MIYVKKRIASTLFLGLTIFALTAQSAEACSAFIIGKDLTTDGTALFGRTEDYPFRPYGGLHNKNLVLYPARNYAEGEMIEDLSTGFTYPHLAHEYQYFGVPDSSRDTDEGIYDAHGVNEFGVVLSATVSLDPHRAIAGKTGVDPLVEDGLAEAILPSVVLPRVKTAREAIELIAKIVDEKGSAEGNTVIAADENEIWYMEIISGHQYAAIKFPDDKFAIFPNTLFLGYVDPSDTENVIVSKALEETARKANRYKEVDGKFHIAASYGPDTMNEGNRSRAYAGIKLLDPNSPVTYQDERYDLLRQPTDPSKKYTVADAIEIQRNRFETLPEFLPDDQKPEGLMGEEANKYKYAPGNENVIDAHIYQMRTALDNQAAPTLWLGLGASRNTPYIPIFGNITKVYEAFSPTSDSYSPDSWFWVAQHIDRMAVAYPNIFGTKIKERWQAIEKEFVKKNKTEANLIGYLNSPAADEYATRTFLTISKELFADMKELEQTMIQMIINETGQLPDTVKNKKVKTIFNKAYENFQSLEKKDTQISPADLPFFHRNYLELHGMNQDTQNSSETQKGWIKENGQWAFYKDGKKITGWMKDGDTWYFMDEAGHMATGWVKDGNTWYYLEPSGAMTTGWKYDNGEWYYLNTNGSMATGWKYDNGEWYYLKDNGAMVANAWVKHNNTWYYVKGSGAMAKNEMTPDGYKVDSTGAWIK